MSSRDDSPLLRHAPATVQGRYLVVPPHTGVARHHFFGFHGQAQTAEVMADAFSGSVPDDDWLVVSVQALNIHYAGRNQEVVASWMTRLDREVAISTNVSYVDTVVEQVEREFGAADTRVFAGFSQGVGMAYRAGVLGRYRCNAIVTVGGDVPPELAATATAEWPEVLAMTGKHDPYFPPDALEKDADALRVCGVTAHTGVFDGRHEWAAGARVGTVAFLRRIANGPARS